MNSNQIWLPLLALVAAPVLVAAEPTPRFASPSRAEWSAYWNQGKAEITSYRLQQSRYGELHDGHSVLVFVTEPFSRSKKVKLDAPGRAGDDAVEVLKLNQTRKFATGLYPYSIMQSVFTPTSGDARALKLTATIQEWCGHVFMQLTEGAGGYRGALYSYFESEGDRTLEVPAKAWLEDDLWNTLRIDPAGLPLGDVLMVPSATFLRLRHVAVGPQRARATLVRKDASTLTYEVRYPDLGRSLRIDFSERFPFEIQGWREQDAGRGQRLTTVATRQASIMSAYWTKNRKLDRRLRKELSLP